MPASRRRPAAPRAVLVLVGVAAALVTTVLLPQLAWLLAPVFLALVIAVVVGPVFALLRRRGVPQPVALVLLLLTAYGVVVGLAAVLVVSLARLVSILPQYSAAASALLAGLLARLAELGVGLPGRQALLSALDLNRVARVAASLLRHVAGFGASVAFLMSLLLFLGIESTQGAARLAALGRSRPALAAALAGFVRNTRRFLVVSTVFGVVTGFADTLLLLWLGVPLAVLWGLLAVATNYIPYVGFVLGVVPPALLALLDSGWRACLVVVVGYVVLNAVLNSLIQPFFLGDAVSLSMTVTLVSLVFWAWVLGPLGAILAIPLTLLVKAVLVDADPRAGWAQAFLGSQRTFAGTPVTSPASSERPDERHEDHGDEEPVAEHG